MGEVWVVYVYSYKIYKSSKDPKLMDLMKDLTLVKQKIEKRLKGRPLTS